MKKKILAGLTIELLMFSAVGMADPTNTVISDHFDDGILDPAWSISITQATGWSYTEIGTNLNVTDIAATDSGWACVNLKQEFAPLTDFKIDFGFSWDSEGSDNAMQNVHVQAYTQDGTMIAYAGYSDGVFGDGAKFGKAGSAVIDEGPGYPMPGSGSAIININRTGSDIEILWDDALFLTGMGDDLIDRVDLVFSYRLCEEAGITSFFGSEAVDFINVEGTIVPIPGAVMLGMLGLSVAGMKLRKRREL